MALVKRVMKMMPEKKRGRFKSMGPRRYLTAVGRELREERGRMSWRMKDRRRKRFS